jgi:predicted Rossmann fold nucleotide-binding protein DprA/Smf involved in DNA uptake
MELNNRDQAVILLTVWFSSSGKGALKPLTPSEWLSFSSWIKEKDKLLDALLTENDVEKYLEGWENRAISIERIRFLLGRSGALALSLERWNRAGLWVITCFDEEYPLRLRNRMMYMPPVLFGCGNKKILNNGGVAVIGSRDVTDKDLEYTKNLGAEIVSQGYSVVSGGARGVDEAAMSGALEKEGTVIGVLSDSLLRSAISSKYRKALINGDLVLISSFNPEAGFDVGNAMARNKYIYCLSDASIVIASTKDKGGTWRGAIENLSNKWVPLWVKRTNDNKSGNHNLIAKGGRWLPESGLSGKDLFDKQELGQKETKAEDVRPLTYEAFLSAWGKSELKGSVSKDQLSDKFNIGKKCLDQWLKHGVLENKIIKYKKPVRYQLANMNQMTLDLFQNS